MNISEIKALLDRYLDGSATPSERQQVEQWLEQTQRPHHEWLAMTAEEKAAWLKDFYDETLAIIRQPREKSAGSSQQDSSNSSGQAEQPGQTGKSIELPSSDRRNPWRSWLQAAAVLIILAGGGIYYFQNRSEKQPAPIAAIPKPAAKPAAVKPGSNRAILTLSDGTTIDLDSAQSGVLAQQGNAAVTKNGEQLIYQSANSPATSPATSAANSAATSAATSPANGAATSAANAKSPNSPSANGTATGASNSTQNLVVAYNTLATPRGGQYKLILPDGSRVWLNAASSIKYPTTFAQDQRNVEITGEAYFEVASLPSPIQKGAKWPFKVTINSEGQNEHRGTVEVLGTHFNINAYNDEPAIRTTLLEGSVKIASNQGPGRLLTPGQQARLDATGKIDIGATNTEEAVAWKDGLFLMNKADISAVLRQLARWYDVEITYHAQSPKGHITGDFPRTMALSDALKILSISGVHCTLQGRKIMVDP